MADQQSMQAIMQALGQMNGPQQGGAIPGNLGGAPVNGNPLQAPISQVIGGIPGNTEGGVELQGMYPGAQIPGTPVDYRNPMDPRFDPRNPNLSTSQPNGDFGAVMQALMGQMGQGNSQSDFLNGLFSGIFGGQRPPVMGRMPSQPGYAPRMPTPGYPGGMPNPSMPPTMRGPGFGMTGPGVPVSPIAGPGGAFGNARTTQPVMNQPQMPTFGGTTKRPF